MEYLLAQQFTLQTHFLFFAVPCIVAAIAIWSIQEKHGHGSETYTLSNKEV
ncbi:hypothetical protein [Domibacillus aminovorans]|uniref:hypothetical protein n=1 Tax=Domibacillus aminovorans TaxID=29332 RepID=UPI0012FE42D5|nr:hypothetical protein [Domibacillus aminovorans]